MAGVNTGWLVQLAPAHAPPPPGWWPPAPGWWALALLLVLLVAIPLYRLRRPRGRLRRAALRELRQLEAEAGDDVRLARDLENLLRRYALAIYGRETVAGLSGTSWLAFLVEHGAAELSGETGHAFLCTVYGGEAQAEHSLWLKGARNFLRKRP